jgi:hypothetical protein
LDIPANALEHRMETSGQNVVANDVALHLWPHPQTQNMLTVAAWKLRQKYLRHSANLSPAEDHK